MPRRTLLLIVTLWSLLTLSACGDDPDEPPFTVPPTPEAGTPVFEPTVDIAAPVGQSRAELVTPGADDTPPDDVDQIAGGDDIGTDNVFSAVPGDDGVVTAELAGVEFPLPEGTTLVQEVDEEDAGEGAIRQRSNRATFLAPDLSAEQVVEFYRATLPASGYEVNEVAGGGEQNLVLQFLQGTYSGVLSVVTEGEEQGTRFSVALEDMGE